MAASYSTAGARCPAEGLEAMRGLVLVILDVDDEDAVIDGGLPLFDGFGRDEPTEGEVRRQSIEAREDVLAGRVVGYVGCRAGKELEGGLGGHGVVRGAEGVEVGPIVA